MTVFLYIKKKIRLNYKIISKTNSIQEPPSTRIAHLFLFLAHLEHYERTSFSKRHQMSNNNTPSQSVYPSWDSIGYTMLQTIQDK